jgi:hypothetical protein
MTMVSLCLFLDRCPDLAPHIIRSVAPERLSMPAPMVFWQGARNPVTHAYLDVLGAVFENHRQRALLKLFLDNAR